MQRLDTEYFYKYIQYKHRLPSLISCRKSDFVKPREQITQVNDKSTSQEVTSGGDAGCDSAVSWGMAIAATIIGQHPLNHNMLYAYYPSGWEKWCFVCR
jgi:hypothetical protein